MYKNYKVSFNMVQCAKGGLERWKHVRVSTAHNEHKEINKIHLDGNLILF
jgi:hypothetical protein